MDEVEYGRAKFTIDGWTCGEFIVEADLISIKEDFQLYPEDVMVATYPKTGTTWVEYITVLILKNGKVEEVNKKNLDEQCPFIELNFNGLSLLEIAKSTPPPRVLKTHLKLPYVERCLREGQSKLIYVVRNPKDTLVSYYHFHRSDTGLGHFSGTFDQFFEFFRQKKLLFGDMGEHFSTWCEAINDNKINGLIVKYEDLINDLEAGVRKIAEFLGKNLSDGSIARIVEAATFNSMSKNPKTNYEQYDGKQLDFSKSKFMRKGKVGDWKNHFNAEQSEYVDKTYADMFAKAGLTFDYE